MSPFIIRLTGDLDITRRRDMEAVVRACAKAGRREVCVDLRAVPFMDGYGLAMLIELRNLARARGGRIVLLDPPRTTQVMLDATGLRPDFEVADEDLLAMSR